MIYNENYQTGTILAFEFLEDNSGKISPVVSTYMFFTSIFNSEYHVHSVSTRVFHIILCCLYGILLLYFAYKEIAHIISTIKSSCSQGVSMFELNDLYTLSFLVLNITSSILFITNIIFDAEIVTINVTEQKFQEIVDDADVLYALLLVC